MRENREYLRPLLWRRRARADQGQLEDGLRLLALIESDPRLGEFLQQQRIAVSPALPEVCGGGCLRSFWRVRFQ